MKSTILSSVISIVIGGTAFAQFGPPVDNGPASLKDAYDGYFTIGVAVNKRNISDPDQMALI